MKLIDACSLEEKLWPTLLAAAAAKSLQLCPTLCDPRDGSPPGSPVPGILQARTLDWVAIAFFNAWNWKLKVKLLSCLRLLVTPWTAAYQAPPSMGFSGQEYWSGVPLPSPIYIYNIYIHTYTHTYIQTYKNIYNLCTYVYMGFPSGSDGKESACNAGDLGSITRLRRPPGGRHGNLL